MDWVALHGVGSGSGDRSRSIKTLIDCMHLVRYSQPLYPVKRSITKSFLSSLVQAKIPRRKEWFDSIQGSAKPR